MVRMSFSRGAAAAAAADTRTSTIVVAASNSLDPTLAPAAYRCSGAADQVEINAALVAAAAVNGRVELLEGAYVTAATISVAVNVTLVGNGWGSVINFNAGGNAITIAGDNVKLRDFKVVIVAGAGAGGTRPNGIYATARTNIEITKLWLYGDQTESDDGSDDRQNGILLGPDMAYSKIALNTIQNFERHAITLGSTEGNEITYIEVAGNLLYGNLDGGVLLNYANYCIVTGNYSSNTDYGIDLIYVKNCVVSGNTCKGSLARGGIILQIAVDCTITGNTCIENDDDGIKMSSSVVNCVVVGNTLLDNTQSGIFLSVGCNNNTITGNVCSGNTKSGIELVSVLTNTVVGNTCSQNVRHGIFLESDTHNNTVVGNTCNENDVNDTNTYDGICIDRNCDYNLVMGNTCNDNDRWGISIGITADDCDGNWVKNNHLRGNTSGAFSDQGTDTKLATKTFPFIAGGDVDGTAIWASYISATASAKGWSVAGADDWAQVLGQLPLELQQIVRIKIWAVALGGPIGGGGQMHLEINMNAGADNLSYTTEPVALANFDGETVDYVADDVIHWVVDSSDDADIGSMVGGMSIEIEVIYETGADPDGATNAVFRTVEIEYV